MLPIEPFKKFKISVNSDFSEIDMSNMWNDNLSLTNSFQYPFDNGKKSITINPAIHKMDGFFISMFQRKRQNNQFELHLSDFRHQIILLGFEGWWFF